MASALLRNVYYERDGIPFVDSDQRDSARLCRFPEFIYNLMTTRVKR